eukprot:gene20499-22516_t
MNAELLKEYNAFKKRSLATPSVESAKRKATESQNSSSANKTRPPKRKLPAQLLQQAKKQAQSAFDYKTATLVRSKTRFSILASVVDLMRKRYQERSFDPLTLDEILDITKNTDIAPRDKDWLSQEALKNNEKLLVRDGKYSFKPKYPLRDRKSLLRLLEKHDSNGLGGVLLDDIREGLPNADAIIKSASDRILFVTKSNDKKAILFNYDPQYSCTVDEDIQKHWRGVTVEGLGEAGIERYLESAGITVMQGVAAPVKDAHTKRKKASNRKKQFKKLNTHLSGDVLKDYS